MHLASHSLLLLVLLLVVTTVAYPTSYAEPSEDTGIGAITLVLRTLKLLYLAVQSYFFSLFGSSSDAPPPVDIATLQKLCSAQQTTYPEQLICKLDVIADRGCDHQVQNHFRRQVQTAGIVQLVAFLAPEYQTQFLARHPVRFTVPSLSGGVYYELDHANPSPLLHALQRGGLDQVMDIWSALDSVISPRTQLTIHEISELYQHPSPYFVPTGPFGPGANTVSMGFLVYVWERVKMQLVEGALEMDHVEALKIILEYYEYGQQTSSSQNGAGTAPTALRMRIIVRAFELGLARSQSLAWNYYQALDAANQQLLRTCAQQLNFHRTAEGLGTQASKSQAFWNWAKKLKGTVGRLFKRSDMSGAVSTQCQRIFGLGLPPAAALSTPPMAGVATDVYGQASAGNAVDQTPSLSIPGGFSNFNEVSESDASVHNDAAAEVQPARPSESGGSTLYTASGRGYQAARETEVSETTPLMPGSFVEPPEQPVLPNPPLSMTTANQYPEEDDDEDIFYDAPSEFQIDTGGTSSPGSVARHTSPRDRVELAGIV
ncbi:hypothetical protein IWQ60_011092 [Tieghemiomyces parasiticus]|uniref:Uncharacterized protein n=1 Tax=Tieghemiomyces parasiticus TaxID=78921 RepID=A0A9W7ZHZ3_9FUNG|nr:hypothetical protein IWQ60_011092 [Tieghemiomyces parasiticus]